MLQTRYSRLLKKAPTELCLQESQYLILDINDDIPCRAGYSRQLLNAVREVPPGSEVVSVLLYMVIDKNTSRIMPVHTAVTKPGTRMPTDRLKGKGSVNRRYRTAAGCTGGTLPGERPLLYLCFQDSRGGVVPIHLRFRSLISQGLHTARPY
jgi:hypothetical protein